MIRNVRLKFVLKKINQPEFYINQLPNRTVIIPCGSEWRVSCLQETGFSLQKCDPKTGRTVIAYWKRLSQKNAKYTNL